MMRSILRGTTALLVAVGLAMPAAGTASAAPARSDPQTVTVVGSGNAVHLSTDSVSTGSIRFQVSTTHPQTPEGGGSSVSLFRLEPGKSLADFFAALREEFTPDTRTAAKGTRDLTATAIFRGLAQVVPGHPATVTETLQPATYYAMDLGARPASGRPTLSTLHVRAGGNGSQHSDLRSQLRVTTVDNRFTAPAVWPHAGTYTFRNNSDTIHFMYLVPVKPDTSDAAVQAFFDAVRHGTEVTPPFAPGPTGGNDVVSPGFDLQLTYDLPPGRYVLVCYIADARTGLPHAFLGMHRVVVLH